MRDTKHPFERRIMSDYESENAMTGESPEYFRPDSVSDEEYIGMSYESDENCYRADNYNVYSIGDERIETHPDESDERLNCTRHDVDDDEFDDEAAELDDDEFGHKSAALYVDEFAHKADALDDDEFGHEAAGLNNAERMYVTPKPDAPRHLTPKKLQGSHKPETWNQNSNDGLFQNRQSLDPLHGPNYQICPKLLLLSARQPTRIPPCRWKLSSLYHALSTHTIDVISLSCMGFLHVVDHATHWSKIAHLIRRNLDE